MRKFLITILVLVSVLGGAVYGLNKSREISDLTERAIEQTNRREKETERIEQTEVEIPPAEEETEPDQTTSQTPESGKSKEVDFEWNYDNKEYRLTITLPRSTYDYYSSQPKQYSYTGTKPQDWKNEYYNMFLETAQGDNTFSALVSKLEQVGKETELTDDQIVELTVSFIQAIPYDESMSIQGSLENKYPYQVLYENKGVCSGKSFLGALLMKELGYGVSLFTFEQANHMVIGIKCPEQYDSYDSGYCYTELTTPGWKIGIEDFQDLEDITSTSRTPSLKGEPEIYEIADGETYRGVAETMRQKERIKELKQEIEQLEAEINNTKEELEYYESIEDYESYNELVPVYNDLVDQHREKAEIYNNLIEEFSPSY